LHFNNRFVKFIVPKIQLQSDDEDAAASIFVWNYKIRPLVRGNNILPLKDGTTNAKSLGFIASPKLLYIYAKNNNNSLIQPDISKIVDKYLLPFNTNSVFVYADKY
jgi:hypothetical protein